MSKFWFDADGVLLVQTDGARENVAGASGYTETPPEDGKQTWTGQAWEWPNGQPIGPTVIAPLAFRDRFDQAERVAIRQAEKQDDNLADWMDLVRTAQAIDLEDQRTIAGMQALVDAGLITASRRDEILTP